MELREYIAVLRKNWILVVVATLLGLGAGAGVSLLVAPEYESRTQLFVSVRAVDGSTGDLAMGFDYAQQSVSSYIAVVKTGVVLDPVVDRLQLDMTGAELAKYVGASTPAASTLIDITAKSPSAEQAATIANAVGQSLQEVVQTRLEPESASGRSSINLTTTQTALVPESPVAPNIPLNLTLGVLIGLALGYGIALLRSAMDNRIHSLKDLEQLTDKPLLGGIVDDRDSKKNRLIVNSQSQGPRAESYRALRTNLQFVDVDSPGQVRVVTSPHPADGKTTTALNLAFTLSQAGSRVAVVEGDLRLPSMAEYLGIEGGAGLTDVLIGNAELADVIQRWGRTQVHVLVAGRIPPNPSELLGSAEMEAVLKSLESQFDAVIIDTPPVLSVIDAAVIGKKTGGVLLVVAAGSTKKQDVENSLRVLETAGANVLGVVATRLPAKGSAADSYGYGNYGRGSYGEGEVSVQNLIDGHSETQQDTAEQTTGSTDQEASPRSAYVK